MAKMCKKKPIVDQPPFTNRTLVGVVVGDYPGTQNDLNGPPEDIKDLRAKVASIWDDITIREFKDREATASRFLSELREAVSRVGETGMLFILMDNCHAESNTRNGRFKKFRDLGYEKVLVFSAARAAEYASDAEFNGGANGAWSYCLIKTLEDGITYRQWFDRAVALLKQLGFKQNPVIEGPEELQNRLVFEGDFQAMIVSSHGGQKPDNDGDESDGLDEVIFFYDRALRDDEIRQIIENTKSGIFAKNKLIKTVSSMKAKSFREKKDWRNTWLQTAVSIVGLAFVVLVSFGVVSPEQSAEAQPIINTTLGAVATIITGVTALIGIFAKQDAPVE